jgi:hypothetical protein
MNLPVNRDLFIKPIDEVRDWPSGCATCGAIHNDRREAERHRELTGHEDIEVQATGHEMELVDVMKNWESAFCTDCDARFATQREAAEHAKAFGHSIVHAYGSRAVN